MLHLQTPLLKPESAPLKRIAAHSFLRLGISAAEAMQAAWLLMSK